MDYARRFQVWGQGMLIALAFVVAIFAFGSLPDLRGDPRDPGRGRWPACG